MADTAIIPGVGSLSATGVGPNASPGDPYWNETVLLLHLNGSNGSTTITDAKGHTVAVRGTTTISTAQSKFGGASAVFNSATGDGLSITHASDLNNSGDFTVELWIRCTSFTAGGQIVGKYSGDSGSVAGPLVIYRGAGSAQPGLYVSSNGTTWDLVSALSFGTLTVNTWHHLAASRKGNVYRTFLDGVLQNSVTASGTPLANTRDLRLGWAAHDAPSGHVGNIDEFRLTNGVARYTATFTPSTWPFTEGIGDFIASPAAGEVTTAGQHPTSGGDPYWNEVVMAVRFDGANGSTALNDLKGNTWTPQGNAQISTARSKFGGASGYLDGNGDYWTTPSSSNFNFGAGAFTIEGWFNLTGYSPSHAGSYVCQLIGKDFLSAREFTVNIVGTASSWTSLQYTGFSNNSSPSTASANYNFALNTWYHFAVSRIGNTVYLFVDGVLQSTTSFTTTNQTTSQLVAIGSSRYDATYTYYVPGYVDDFRITKGIGRYSQSFQLPQATFPASVGYTEFVVQPGVGQISAQGQTAFADKGDPYWNEVALALHMDGASGGTTFTDEKGLTVTPSNTTTSTAQYKFGTAAASLNGSSSYLSLAGSVLQVGSADFTIEAWVRIPSTPSPRMTIISNYWGGGNRGIDVALDAGPRPSFRVSTDGSSDATSVTHAGTAMSLNTWYHVACVRRGNNIQVFLDGVGSSLVSLTGSIFSASGPTHIGRTPDTGSGVWYFSGFIDDLRVTKGIARYSGTFTPPTRTFVNGVGPFEIAVPQGAINCEPSQTFTSVGSGDVDFDKVSLLLHMDAAPGSGTVTDVTGKTITVVGGATHSAVQKKFGPTSFYFDGVNDYLSVPHSTDLNFSSGDFTIDLWYYRVGGDGYIVDKDGVFGSFYPGVAISISGTGIVVGYLGSGTSSSSNHQVTATTAVSVGAWTHIAFTRQGTQIRLFINGVLQATTTQSLSFTDQGRVLRIGNEQGAASFINGYIDDLRYTKGVARYTQTFTPPTTSSPDFLAQRLIEAGPGAIVSSTPTPSMVAETGDQYFNETVLLLHCDGTNGGTTFTDVKGKAVTANGDVQTSTAQSKFGGSSALFDGNGDYLTTPNSADFNFGTGDFTVECWFRLTATGDKTLLSTYVPTTTGWTLQNNTGKLIFNCSGDGADVTGTTTLGTGVWYHAAVTRSGTTLRLFLNGTLEASVTDSQNITSTQALYVGALPGFTSSTCLNGNIDEVRVTKGVARYTSNFTPRTTAFPDFGVFVVTEPGSGTLTTDGQVPALSFEEFRSPDTVSVSVEAQAPEVYSGPWVSTDVGAVTVSGDTPSLLLDLIATPAAAGLTFYGAYPLEGPRSVYPEVGGVLASGQTPAPQVVLVTIISPGVGALVSSGQTPTRTSPTVSLRLPAQGAMTVAGQAPLLAFKIPQGTGYIQTTGEAPSLFEGKLAAPGVGQIGVTGYATTAGRSWWGQPGRRSVTLTGLVPTLYIPATQEMDLVYGAEATAGGEFQVNIGQIRFNQIDFTNAYATQVSKEQVFSLGLTGNVSVEYLVDSRMSFVGQELVISSQSSAEVKKEISFPLGFSSSVSREIEVLIGSTYQVSKQVDVVYEGPKTVGKELEIQYGLAKIVSKEVEFRASSTYPVSSEFIIKLLALLEVNKEVLFEHQMGETSVVGGELTTNHLMTDPGLIITHTPPVIDL